MEILQLPPMIKTQRYVLKSLADGKCCWQLSISLLNRLFVADIKIHREIMMIILLSFFSCQMESPTSKEKFEVVTYKQFNEFVKTTGYVTDAEKFGWSIVQQDVFTFIKVNGANWRKPDGRNKPKTDDLPVTQVSYNDAIAYCEWSKTKLPYYEQYWELIEKDERKIVVSNNAPISEVDNVNVLGNVWEITRTEKGNEVRLAGGSLFCSSNTCHGTSKERELYVDKETGNIHIGFAVMK